MTVYVVLFGIHADHGAEEWVAHIASTHEKAQRYVDTWPRDYTGWYEIHAHVVDAPESK